MINLKDYASFDARRPLTTDEDLNRLLSISKSMSEKSKQKEPDSDDFLTDEEVEENAALYNLWEYVSDELRFTSDPQNPTNPQDAVKVSRTLGTEEHIENIKKILLTDYKDNPSLLKTLQSLNFAETIQDADNIFNKFVEKTEEEENFREGLNDFIKVHKDTPIAYNTLLAEAHSLFTNEEIKNPYENDIVDINNEINRYRESIWKEIELGEYYDGKIKVIKKTPNCITMNIGDKEIKFSKKDMNILCERGFCRYFNFWKDSYCVPSFLLVDHIHDRHNVLSVIIDSLKEKNQDLYYAFFDYNWENHPEINSIFARKHAGDSYSYIEDVNSYTSEIDFKNTFHSELDDTSLDLLGKTKEQLNEENTSIANIIYNTKWAEENPELFDETFNKLAELSNHANEIRDKANERAREIFMEKFGTDNPVVQDKKTGHNIAKIYMEAREEAYKEFLL